MAQREESLDLGDQLSAAEIERLRDMADEERPSAWVIQRVIGSLNEDDG